MTYIEKNNIYTENK